MKILLLINILLSTAIARCASSSSTFDGSTPRVVQVNIASGKTVEISVSPDTTFVDLKRQLRQQLCPESINPTKLVYGTETVEDSKRLQEILNGTEEPRFTLVIQELTAHSSEEREELQANLEDGEGFVSLMRRVTLIKENKDGTSTKTELIVPWDDTELLCFVRTPFDAYWKNGSVVYKLLPVEGERFEPKSYFFIIRGCGINREIWADLVFKTRHWNFESAAEPRFKVETVGMFLIGDTLPESFLEKDYRPFYQKLIVKRSETFRQAPRTEPPTQRQLLLPEFKVPPMELQLLNDMIPPEYPHSKKIVLLTFESGEEGGFTVTKLRS